MDEAKSAWVYARQYRWKALLSRACQPRYWVWWALTGCIITAAILLAVYEDRVVEFIGLHGERIKSWPCSWVGAIVLLWIFAIPPMIGQAVAVLTIGLIWGMLRGCALVAFGRTTGELWVFLAVRWKFEARAIKIEQQNVLYGCIAEILRHGGLGINTAVRLSYISGHVITILQSLTGVPTWMFVVAQIPDLAPQFALVWMGT
ncbi:hypothetical protein OIO90_006252 [Microbotryomycetes sp. JL221]|nr:hypothetical protein OIO90_006252 [Microbotryomycetes sp. JL221]